MLSTVLALNYMFLKSRVYISFLLEYTLFIVYRVCLDAKYIYFCGDISLSGSALFLCRDSIF